MLRNSKKAKEALCIILLGLGVYIFVNYYLISGLIDPPEDAVYIKNFDDKELIKTWDALKEEHEYSIDPKKITAWSSIQRRIYYNSMINELKYANNLATINLNIILSMKDKFLLSPHILLIVLDDNGYVRGKLYVPLSLGDIPSQGIFTKTFWFRVPSDMENERFSVIIELFGKVESSYDIEWGHTIEIHQGYDEVYGLLPKKNEERDRYTMLFYERDDTGKTPLAHIGLRSALEYASLLVVFLYLVFAVLFLARRKIASFTEKHSGRVSIIIIILGMTVIIEFVIIMFLTH